MAVFSKSDVPQFAVDIYQNEYLPEGGREVNAIVTVTATGGGTLGGLPLGAQSPSPAQAYGTGPDAAVVVMVDCSGSMDNPPTKMRNARDATAAAIDTIRDGVAFGVIAGTHEAYEVYPADGRLAVADSATRHQAKQAVGKLAANGGTAIGSWLWLADELLATADVPIRHGILLTDGRNEHEAPGALRAVLDACAGRFTCDARGVGTDWEVKELTDVASALLGTVDIVADPSGLADDFRQMMENAMGKGVADVALRVWTPQGSEVKWVKQVAPTVEDLTLRRAEVGPRAGDYPTGSWGDESRDYHVCIKVPRSEVGEEMLAGRISLVVPQPDGTAQAVAQGLVRACWTDDMAASTRINAQVAHYTGQAELAQVIQEGLEARKQGDFDSATAKLGRAVQLASVSGNEETSKLLAKVVDVVDAASGTVRLKARVADADEMTLETRSTKTVRVKK
ncbi:vWA domain-containing protein [Streptomyces sp. STR69]|uniref:vWA domain-containing protein n=1 Tax=Streptomyces sp. STR69 TaxID=1796942 RepID=UPI0021C86A22|nr:VWA domain-containing protein [Streptomyces sp. STR69]